jgi:ABC-type uncharacterized transport system ATPase subunit
MTIIFVTHKLQDAEDLCGKVTVLRLGKITGEVTRPLHHRAIGTLDVRSGVGKHHRAPPSRRATSFSTRAICASPTSDCACRTFICARTRARSSVSPASKEADSGCSCARAPASMRPKRVKLWIDGVKMNRQPYREFLARGIVYLPAGRLEEGLVPGLTLTEHFILAQRSREFFINWNAAQTTARARIAEYNIRGTPASRVEALSGGNQQRALLALLPTDLKLILLEHPTRGLDIESTLWVWHQLLERRARGTTIVFTSADLDEILEYSDHILVFSGGRVARALNARETSVQQLGELIGGKGLEIGD